MTYDLPTALEIDGIEYEIRTDYRVILGLLEILNDPEFSNEGKAQATIETLIIEWENVRDYKEALERCFWFIDMGQSGGKKTARLVDWEKDYPYIVAPINRVLGYECRAVPSLHWWTFLSAYMEIGGECTFAQIVNIRSKLKKGKKLEKHEREWLRQNNDIVNLPQKYTAEDDEILKKWTGG